MKNSNTGKLETTTRLWYDGKHRLRPSNAFYGNISGYWYLTSF